MPYTIKNKTLSQRGNAMIYVLIALALFGFLTTTLSRSNDQADGQDIDDEQAVFYATELIEYVASAQNAVDMMVASGSEINELNFVNPTSVGFNTTPPKHYNKVFHPQGGGLTYQPNFSAGMTLTAASAWKTMTIQNTEWTETVAPDKLLTASHIPQKICEILNEKITGSSDVPTLTTGGLQWYFSESGTNADFTAAVCPECVGRPSLCVADNTNNWYGFYNIIAAQ